MLEADIVITRHGHTKKPSYAIGLCILTFRHALMKICLPLSKP
jgi:hypothetical protein